MATIGDHIHDWEQMKADFEGNTGVIFDLAGQELGIWDFETSGAVARIYLTPPDYFPPTLDGTGPEDYVRMAARLLEYAGGPNSGDHGSLDDDTEWKTSIRGAAHVLRSMDAVGDDSHLETHGDDEEDEA